jgi:signal transduction histidine kinase
LIVLVLSAIIFAIFSSKNIALPLVQLSETAKTISEGKVTNRVDDSLLIREDEIGSLSKSFNKMVDNLNSEIEIQKSVNISLLETEQKLAEKNSELAKRDTKLVEMNAELKQLNSQLKALDSQKDEFISLAAHELKTPLTSIRGFSQLLHSSSVFSDPVKSRHYLDLIDSNTNRLYSLVVDLVDSSRLNLGKLKLNIESVDPYKLFDDVRENMSLIISDKGLTPKFFADEHLPHIFCDYERSMQVLRNLITNSVKFTPAGTIYVGVTLDADFVKFEVSDTGQGIPEENKAMIFSRFYQVDSSVTRKVGGSGLGLSICKGLVDNMGGKIWFESEVGKGSKFFFTLPTKKPELESGIKLEEKNSETKSEIKSVDSSNPKILINNSASSTVTPQVIGGSVLTSTGFVNLNSNNSSLNSSANLSNNK